MNQTTEQTRHALFNTTAPRYQQRIMPAFGPLADSLVNLATLCPSERVIDLGTGIGAAAFPAGETAHSVVGMDYAPAMFPIAQQIIQDTQSKCVTFYQGDMTTLPHPAHSFQVALASFGFNGIDPVKVFPEIYRILEAGGRLVFQEWGTVEAASKCVKQAVKQHKVAEADGFLAELRQLGQTPKPWDTFGDVGPLIDLLQDIGFNPIQISLEKESIPLTPQTFFHYKTAWAPYQAELNAMTAETRAEVEAEVMAHLSPWVGPDGRFLWEPELLRVVARK
ncbi:MAG: class I SAM-dependent methyltransferase [Chloroflexota bacterium]